jgi:hypothetical protein
VDPSDLPVETLTEILARARVLIDAGGWCQRAEARDSTNRPAHPAGPSATSWSLTGAIYAAARFDGTPERRSRYEAAVAWTAQVLGSPPGAWNDADGRTREDVLGAIDTALARLPSVGL